jgi:hypothetical protein
MHRFDAALDGKVQSGIEGLIKRQSRELVQQESCDGRTPVKSLSSNRSSSRFGI